jgi:pyrrolidone-carboxylate peptidase
MNKILVTGFEPFNGGKTNSSMLVLEELKAMGYETKLLPVSYKRAR